MMIYFTKMHGLGNDFVVIDLITQRVKFEKEHVQRIADRNLGVGCDQLIFIEPPIRSTADFYYRIFNANGNEAEQCGNGARCAVKFFYDNRFTNNRTLEMDCLAGSVTGKIEEDNRVTVSMGIPEIIPDSISLNVEDTVLSMRVVSMGNPHAILETPNIDTALVHKMGSLISTHPYFPKETNVEFMQILDRNHIRLRVFERGVGETLACGSGAAAAVVSGIRSGVLESPVTVDFSKGQLKITWEKPEAPVYLTGPATLVFMGRLCL